MGQTDLRNVSLANDLKILVEEGLSFSEQEGTLPVASLQIWMKYDLFSGSPAC